MGIQTLAQGLDVTCGEFPSGCGKPCKPLEARRVLFPSSSESVLGTGEVVLLKVLEASRATEAMLQSPLEAF